VLLALTIGLITVFGVPAGAASVIDSSKSTVVVSKIPGPADHFAITGPAVTPAGTVQYITITAYDAEGNVATDYTGIKSLSFSGASTPSNGVASYPPIIFDSEFTQHYFPEPADINFISGVAEGGEGKGLFIYLRAAETAHITATDSADNINTAVPLDITVSALSASHVIFGTAPPSEVTAGEIWPPCTGKLIDDYGNVITDDNTDSITISLNGGGDTLQGTLTRPMVNGIATFDDLSMTEAGNVNLLVTYTGTTYEDISSEWGGGSVYVNPAALDHFVLYTLTGEGLTEGITVPQTAGAEFYVILVAVDEYGNTVTDDEPVSMSTGVADTGVVVTALDGDFNPLPEVEFQNGQLIAIVTLTSATSEQSLTFTGDTSGKTGASGTFTVNPGAASQLAFTVQPASTGSIDHALTTQPTVRVEDQYGNVCTGDTSTITLAAVLASDDTTAGAGTVLNDSLAAVNGMAAFTNAGYNGLDTIHLKATDGALTPAVSTTDIKLKASAPPAPIVHHTGGGSSDNFLNINTNGAITSVVISSRGYVRSYAKASSSDANLEVNIPSGTRITNSDGSVPGQINITIDTGIPDPPSGSNFIGVAYNCTPDGLVFDTPITMVWHYSDTDIKEGMDESSLKAAFYNTATSTWIDVPCAVDTVNNTVTATISHFTEYAVMGTAAPTPSPTPTPSATPTPSQSPTPSTIPTLSLSPAPSTSPTTSPTPTPALPTSTAPSAPSATLPASTLFAPSASTTPPPPPTPASNWGLILVIVVVVIVIILVVWFVLKRKRKTT
jgi:hypothetical protein